MEICSRTNKLSLLYSHLVYFWQFTLLFKHTIFFENNNDPMYTLKLSGSYYGFDQWYLGFWCLGSDSDCMICGHLWLWSQNYVIASWLRLTATSNWILTSILNIYKVFELIDMLSIGILWYQPYRVTQLIGPHLGVLGDLWSRNDGIMSWLRLAATSTLLPESI